MKQVNMTYVAQRIKEVLNTQQTAWLVGKKKEIAKLEKGIAMLRNAFFGTLPAPALRALALEYVDPKKGYDGPVKRKLHAQAKKKASAAHKRLDALEARTKQEYICRRSHAEYSLCPPFLVKFTQVMDGLVLGGTSVEQVLADLQGWSPQ